MARHFKILVICVVVASCGPAMMMPGQSGSRRVPMQQAARPDSPNLKRLKNGHYRVRQPWTVVLHGKTWVVQKGYTSNGMTAPMKIKAALGDGVERPETWAAVFHDWLFTQKGVSRAQADSTFRELLLAYGISPNKADLMYSTVKAYSLTKGLH